MEHRLSDANPAHNRVVWPAPHRDKFPRPHDLRPRARRPSFDDPTGTILRTNASLFHSPTQPRAPPRHHASGESPMRRTRPAPFVYPGRLGLARERRRRASAAPSGLGREESPIPGAGPCAPLRPAPPANDAPDLLASSKGRREICVDDVVALLYGVRVGCTVRLAALVPRWGGPVRRGGTASIVPTNSRYERFATPVSDPWPWDSHNSHLSCSKHHALRLQLGNVGGHTTYFRPFFNLAGELNA